jgi:hypothetical protein
MSSYVNIIELLAEGKAGLGSGATPFNDQGQYPPAFAKLKEINPFEPMTHCV